MKVKQLVSFLNDFAPYAYQEQYDNSGLLVGNSEVDITGVLTSLDCTEKVVEEAIDLGYNTVLAHHPIIFSGLKTLTSRNYVERTVIKAIKNNINLISYHTNLDNVSNGVNQIIANRLGLSNTRILAPKTATLFKLYTYVPKANVNEVLNALFKAGAGKIGNYSECSFQADGVGTFKPEIEAKPHVGEIGARHQEQEAKVEVLVPRPLQQQILSALKSAHPYEEVAYELVAIENINQQIGSGMIGDLSEPITTQAFLQHLKDKMNLHVVKFTQDYSGLIQKIAVCGGSGAFLIKSAMAAGAHAFVSSDIKYHEFFDAEDKMLIADIGHFESERFTSSFLADLLKRNFNTFAVRISEVNTNPISYFK